MILKQAGIKKYNMFLTENYIEQHITTTLTTFKIINITHY